MELRLPSISGVIPWSLAIKAAVVTLVWFWAPWWVFAALTAVFFYQGVRDPDLSYNLTFIAFLITTWWLSLMAGAAATGLGILILPEAAIIIGLRHMMWLKKALWHRFLSALVWLTFLTTFFWLTSFVNQVWYGFIMLAAVAYFLSRDLMRVAIGREQEKFLAGVTTFVLVEAAWAVFMLPIEPINKGVLMLLVSLMAQEYLIRSETGRKATPVFYLTMSSVFVALFLAILFVSSWTI